MYNYKVRNCLHLFEIYILLIYLFIKDSSSFINDTLLSTMENKHCEGFTETMITNNTISYCNTDGYISNQTCPIDQIWNEDYSQCVSPSSRCQFVFHEK